MFTSISCLCARVQHVREKYNILGTRHPNLLPYCLPWLLSQSSTHDQSTSRPCSVSQCRPSRGKRPNLGTVRDLLQGLLLRLEPDKKRSPAELRTFLAKFANLGKGQGIPRPVGIGSGMGVGMAGKPTARGCGVPREPTSDSCSLLPASQSSQSQSKSKSSPVPFPAPFLDLMIPLPRGPLVFPLSPLRCSARLPSQAGHRPGKPLETWSRSPGHRSQSSLLREKTRHTSLGV